MMIKNKILLLIFMILVLALFSQVNSFAAAKVNHAATIKIGSSEDALIGIPENLSMQVEGIDPVNVIENSISIKNNLAQTVDVSIASDNDYITFQDFVIFSGEIGTASVILDDRISSGIVNLSINVKWEGGSALIYKQLDFQVR